MSSEEIRKIIQLLESNGLTESAETVNEVFGMKARSAAKKLQKQEKKRRNLTPTPTERAEDMMPMIQKAYNNKSSGGKLPNDIYIKLSTDQKLIFQKKSYINDDSVKTPFDLMFCTDQNHFIGWIADKKQLCLFNFKDIGTRTKPIIIPSAKYKDFGLPGPTEYAPDFIHKILAIIQQLPEYKEILRHIDKSYSNNMSFDHISDIGGEVNYDGVSGIDDRFDWMR